MFGYLMPVEINQIRRDYSDLLASPEATTVELHWSSLVEDAATDLDEVYGTPLAEIDPKQPSLKVRVLQNILKEDDIGRYSFAFAKIGWAVFFLPTELNLDEPLDGFPVVKDSLYITDPSGVNWTPHNHEDGPQASHAVFRLGQYQSGQCILCHPKK